MSQRTIECVDIKISGVLKSAARSKPESPMQGWWLRFPGLSGDVSVFCPLDVCGTRVFGAGELVDVMVDWAAKREWLVAHTLVSAPMSKAEKA